MQKTFIVDWNDYEQVARLGNMIKSRLGEINPNRVPRRENIRRFLDAAEKIMSTNIDSIYKCTSSERIYYVYCHLDPTRPIAIGKNGRSTFAATLGLTHLPLYVGKGQGDRAKQLARNETHRVLRARLREHGQDVQPFILKDELTEGQAFALEGKLIDLFGLLPLGGCLTNIDLGPAAETRRSLYQDQLDVIWAK